MAAALTWLVVTLLAVVSLWLADRAGDALGRVLLRRRLRDPRSAYLRDFH